MSKVDAERSQNGLCNISLSSITICQMVRAPAHTLKHRCTQMNSDIKSHTCTHTLYLMHC